MNTECIGYYPMDNLPENKYEEHQKSKEHSHIVHGAEHDNQLAPQIR